jgi:endonuclease/exonuclease/phosphatase family metal-dependent hydrolase
MIIETAPRPSRPRGPSARRRRPFLALGCGAYLVGLLALWLVLRELGDRWWIGTLLLMAPRWPYAIPLIVLWPWALLARRWRLVAVTAVATAVLLFLVMGFRVAIPPRDAGRGDLRLLTCNIHRQHLDARQLAEFMAQVQPDVVALQGWTDVHQEMLFSDGQWSQRRIGEVLVASRHPINQVTPVALGDAPEVPPGEQGTAVLCELQTPHGTVHLIALHLASPHAGLNSMLADRGVRLARNVERRSSESRRVRDAAEGVLNSGEPLLIAGDFNTSGDSPLFRECWGAFTDAFEQCGLGFGYTYVINHTQLRIDHILADPSCRVDRCWVGPDVGAAHRPLVADINFR